MRRGFTLIELLVTIVIVSILLGAAYVTYVTILGGFGRETKSVETQIETVVGLELIRLDIEHAGYGVGEDQPDLPLSSPAPDSLWIRSVLNNTRLIRDTVTGDPVHWSLVECNGPGLIPVVRAGDDVTNLPTNNVGLVFLGAANRFHAGTTTNTLCPGVGVFVAMPYDTTVANGCLNQFCNIISYFLSAVQPLQTCNPNTRNLLRAVGNAPGSPLINCVADVRFTFDVDANGDGTVDVRDGDFTALDLNGDTTVTADEVRRGLKIVNVYLLIQEGGFDRDYTFRNFVTCAVTPTDPRLSGDCVVANPTTGVQLNLPVGFANYRWKVIKLSVIPMNL